MLQVTTQPKEETMVEIPAGAKVPQDRKPKKEDVEDLIGGDTIITVRGVDFTIPQEVRDDFELLDDLAQLDAREDATRLPSLLRRLLPDIDQGEDKPARDQWKIAMDLLRGKNGRVTIEDGATFVWDVMTELDPNS